MLEVERADGAELLVPMVGDAVRSSRRGGAGGSTSTWGSSMRIDVFTLFPHWFDWFRTQRHVANALALGHALETVDYRATRRR